MCHKFPSQFFFENRILRRSLYGGENLWDNIFVLIKDIFIQYIEE